LKRTRLIPGLTLALLLACSLLSWSARAEQINIGIISADSPGEGKEMWDPVLADWSRSLNLDIKGFFTNSYAGVLAAALDGRLQVVRLSPRLAMDAVATGKFDVFSQQAWRDGSVGYKALLVVRKGSPLRSIEDVAAAPGRLSYGHAERGSTSGFMVPEQLFAKYQISPALHFTRMVEGTHQANLLAVANGEIDLAASNTTRTPKFAEKFPDESRRIRVIWESTPIPDVMWLIRTDLPPARRAAIERVVLNYARGGKANELATLRRISDVSGFVSAHNGALLPMVEWSRLSDRSAAERAEFPSPAVKAAKLAEIDQRYGEIKSKLRVP
jgi:phosphonate transport system substrate-binding protein